MYFAKFLVIVACCISFLSQAQTPLSIIDALQRAKTANPDLQLNKFNLQLVAADTITAGLKINPILNIQLIQLLDTYAFAEGTQFYSQRNRQGWTQITKEFHVKRQRQNKIDFAKKNYTLSETLFENEKRNLYYLVANQWLDTWILQKRVKLINESQANIDTLVKINENRLKNEVITKTELVRTRILSQQFDAQLIEINGIYNNNLKVLQYLIGATDSLQIVEGAFMDMDVLQAKDSLVAKAEERADKQVAKAQLGAAESNLKLQNSLKYPRPELGFIWNPQNGVIYGGVYIAVPLPIFDRNQGEIQKAKIAIDQSNKALEVIDLRVRNEINRAYALYQNRKARLAQFQKIVEESQLVLNTVRYAYLRGNTTIIDFLDAQRTYYTAQQDYNDALYSLKQSYIELLFVSGQLEKLVEE
ncbi:MAG: TolC family protein [Thermoflexibacteraceae bacterium]|jgi:cobalt-zinc-cadmium efflux system outer membrane protein